MKAQKTYQTLPRFKGTIPNDFPANHKPAPSLKKIICLVGPRNSGKTAVLIGLLEKLLGERITLKGNAKDVRVLFTYKGQKILLATDGDSSGIIQRNCMLCQKHDPDIFILASHPEKLFKVVQDFKSNYKNADFFPIYKQYSDYPEDAEYINLLFKNVEE